MSKPDKDSKKVGESTSAQDEKEAILNLRRAYTTGGKLGARSIFVFNEDGTIKGVQKVQPTQI